MNMKESQREIESLSSFTSMSMGERFSLSSHFGALGTVEPHSPHPEQSRETLQR